jgi:enoyl-CoA hydratase/carnithine racemase
MDAFEEIRFDIAGAVATIIFDRPAKLNAWTPRMEKEVAEAIALADRPEVRAIVLTGAGRGFCAGADLTAPRDPDAQPAGPDRFDFLWDSSKLLVAAVNGPAAGVGLSLSLYCDLRYLAEGAVITTAFAQRGLIAEHGSAWLLPRIVGMQNAADMLFSGRKLAAEEAAAMGLGRLLPQEDFLAHVRRLTADLVAQSSPRSLRVMRKQLHDAASQDFHSACALAHREQQLSLESEDFREGVAAFRERRSAKFTGG